VISAACDRARAWASLDIDGGLSTFEKRLLDRHLDGCGECRTFAEQAALFTLTLRSAPLEPAHVVVDVPRRRGTFVSSAVASVGSIAAVAAAAMLAFGHHGSTAAPQRHSALAAGLATLATNADSMGVRQHELPVGTPRLVGSVRGTFGTPV
jgi:anti-sigma factor RsiW